MATGIDVNDLEREVEDHTARYVRAFNDGDAALINSLYTPEAVAVWEPGRPLTGRAREEYATRFLARRPKISTKIRQSFVTSDTALLIVDWSIATKDDEGAPELLTGVGVDVLRRGEDGRWRYAVDDPFGEGSDGAR